MSPGPAIVGRPARVLVVDDDAENRELLQMGLEWEGFVVQTAASGADALRSVANEPPDLILADARMPGMNGYELTAAIKSNPATENIRVVMLTGRDDEESRTLAQRAGADAFLVKPMSRVALAARLRRLLGIEPPSTPPNTAP